MKRHVFTVPSTGRQFYMKPLSDEMRVQLDMGRNDLPKRPTYTITYPGGEQEQVEHDPTTLETAEDIRAWQEYSEKFKEANAAWNERVVKVMAILCADFEYEDGWEDDFTFLGMTIPTDERERKMFYFNNVLMPTDGDKQAFAETVGAISTVQEDRLAAYEAMFPGALQWHSYREVNGQKPVDRLAELLEGQGYV